MALPHAANEVVFLVYLFEIIVDIDSSLGHISLSSRWEFRLNSISATTEYTAVSS